MNARDTHLPGNSHGIRRHSRSVYAGLPCLPAVDIEADAAPICEPFRHPVRMLVAVLTVIGGLAFTGFAVMAGELIQNAGVQTIAGLVGALIIGVGLMLAFLRVEWGLVEE